MSTTPGGGKGRGRGTGKEAAPPIGIGRGKAWQTGTPTYEAVPPAVEELVRSRQANAKELARQLDEQEKLDKQEHKHDNVAENIIVTPSTAPVPVPTSEMEDEGMAHALLAEVKDANCYATNNVEEGEKGSVIQNIDSVSTVPQPSKTFNLNPNCEEFIPRGPQPSQAAANPTIKLNVDAPEFVPSFGAASPQVGATSPQVAAHGIMVQEMVAPFMGQVPDEELYLLDSAAELLLKCAASPELFDTEMDCLLSTIKLNNPQASTLSNMAMLVVTWGEKDTTLQYVASKFCAQCFVPLHDQGFSGSFIRIIQGRCHEMHQAVESQEVMRFSTFLAELFFRLETEEGNPVWPLGDHLLKLILMLLTFPFDHLVMTVVNMLKLTGELLDRCDVLRAPLDVVAQTLSNIVQENIIPANHVHTAVKQLLMLRSNHWNPPSPYIPVPAAASMYNAEDDTVYFMPTGGADAPAFKGEVQSSHPQQQMPVVNPADWSDYVMEDDNPNAAAGDGNSDADFLEEDDLEAAFEDFLQETNTHYRVYPRYQP